MLPRPIRHILIGTLLTSLLYQYCYGVVSEFQFCYDGNIPHRCEPPAETFSLQLIPVVSSTCGDPPNEFCIRTYSLATKQISSEDCGYICNSSSDDTSHNPEFMTDFFSELQPPTWWQSESGIHRPQSVSIDIALSTKVQVQTVLFQFLSLKPDAFYILRSTDFGESYQPYHYFATDCIAQYMIDPEAAVDPYNETKILCQLMTDPSPGQISFIPSLDRPSSNDSIPGLSEMLYNFSTITNIRVILDGHFIVDTLNDSDYYYALEDLSVVGKCQCNGHSSECNIMNGERVCVCQHDTDGTMCEKCKDLYNDLQWRVSLGGEPFECKICECNGHTDTCVFDEVLFEMSGGISGGRCTECRDNTEGIHCDQCIRLYFPRSDLPVNSTEYCQPCNCNLTGITDDGDCVKDASDGDELGQCSCKTNVEGRVCDMCRPGYYNLQDTNPDGCQDCGCHSNLSDSMLCNNITGVCSCKPHVIGDTCDTCEPGYYLAEPDTCSPCNCDLGGALSNVCDIYTGECTCRTGVTGLTCSEPAENRFFPYIDHFLFEAEESLGVTNFSYRTQSSLDLFTGSGYALINNDVDIINFGSFTPPISGEYDIVIRYNLKNTFVWEEAELRVTVGNEEGDGTPATCVEYSNEEIIYSDWTMGVGQAVFNTICLRGGRSYSLVLNGFIPGSDTAELEIDSMVILLKEPEGLSTFVNPIIQSQYSQCITNFRALATRDNSLNGCRDVSFSVFTELYNGTLVCDCDTLGATSSTCESYGGQCYCKANVIGRQCDRCAAGSFDLSIMGCKECDCSPEGSLSEFCFRIGGQCECISNVEGRTCDTCIDFYFDFIPNVGCKFCDCNPLGSDNQQCYEDGQCECKSGVGGEKCDLCLPDNFNFPTCSECNCSEAGTIETDLSCNIGTGQCSCRKNTEGLKCSQCSSGTFNLQPYNPAGCQPCFCSGLTSSCFSASGFITNSIITNFTTVDHNWKIRSDNGFALINQDLFNEGVIINTNTTAYLVAPDNYLGNKLSSYGQFLSVEVDIGSLLGSADEGHDILLKGEAQLLSANFSQSVTIGNQTLTVQFHESARWTDTQSGLGASAFQLQSILINIMKLEVRVSLGSEVVITSISLESTVPGNGTDVGWVEECNCIYANYTGLSCEQCADGYTRADSGLCVLCDCNGHADICDKITGVCIDCMDNTFGDHCEKCIEGYYSFNLECFVCQCPYSGENGQYSPTCELQGDEIICTQCDEGHEGDMCEVCRPGYFGDPLGYSGNSTRCSNCGCNNNIDFDDPNSCDKVTGICRNCLFNTTGDECELCFENYYGDPIIAKNCTDCECNITGSDNLTCDDSGTCYCKPNIIGPKCDSCDLYHYNFSSGEGCYPCDCHISGSTNEMCDLFTGQCTCKNGVTGRQCDRCLFGFYSLNDNGCKECGCNVLGSNSLQCLEDGSCVCNEGVKGTKCDSCIENYFLQEMTGQCTICPSCYSDLQSNVNITRDYYSSVRLAVNTVAEQNDPEETFEHKRDTALERIEALNISVTKLNSNYGQLYNDVQALEEFLNINLTIILVPEVEQNVLSAKSRVSPVVNLAFSSMEVMMELEMIRSQLYVSQETLTQIKTVILPDVDFYTDTILNITEKASLLIEEVEEHFNILQNQTYQIMKLAVMAAEAANISEVTANLLDIQFNENENNVSNLLYMAYLINVDISSAISQLKMLNVSIMEARITLQTISSDVPTLPSEQYISSLITKSESTQESADILASEIDEQLVLFLSLNNTLTTLSWQFYNLVNQLNQSIETIHKYQKELEEIYQQTLASNTSAQICLSNAQDILTDLQDFNTAITNLKTRADEALLLACNITDFADLAEQEVDTAMKQLENARNTLNEAQPKGEAVRDDSKLLKEESGVLVMNSSSLLELAEEVLNNSSTANSTVDQLNTDVRNTQQDINDLDDSANEIIDKVYSMEIQDLPEQARSLSTDASEIAEDLLEKLLNTPEPDQALITLVQAYIQMVDGKINSIDITNMVSELEMMLASNEDELEILNDEILEIEEEVFRLRKLLESLPPDCDSNYF